MDTPKEPRTILGYHNPLQPDTLVKLRRLPMLEANLAKAKLEAEGIPCFIAGGDLNVIYPVLFTDVELQVASSDLSRAQQILDTPSEPLPADDDDDEDDDPQATGERGYADESFHCPACHRKNVELLPPTVKRKWNQRLFIVILLLPIVAGVGSTFVASAARRDAIRDAMSPLMLPWLLIVIVFAVVLMRSPRQKRCRDCGNEWTSR